MRAGRVAYVPSLLSGLTVLNATTGSLLVQSSTIMSSNVVVDAVGKVAGASDGGAVVLGPAPGLAPVFASAAQGCEALPPALRSDGTLVFSCSSLLSVALPVTPSTTPTPSETASESPSVQPSYVPWSASDPGNPSFGGGFSVAFPVLLLTVVGIKWYVDTWSTWTDAGKQLFSYRLLAGTIVVHALSRLVQICAAITFASRVQSYNCYVADTVTTGVTFSSDDGTVTGANVPVLIQVCLEASLQAQDLTVNQQVSQALNTPLPVSAARLREAA